MKAKDFDNIKNYPEAIKKIKDSHKKLETKKQEISKTIAPILKQIADLQKTVQPRLNVADKISQQMRILEEEIRILKNDSYFKPLKVGDSIIIHHEWFKKGIYETVLPARAKKMREHNPNIKLHTVKIESISTTNTLTKISQVVATEGKTTFFGEIKRPYSYSSNVGLLTLRFRKGSPINE